MMKLAKDKQTRVYELTFLTPANLTESETESLREKVVKILTENKGKVVNQEDWGKKSLAYTLKKLNKSHHEAVYTHLKLKLDPAKTLVFEQQLYLQEQLLRHLLVVSDEEVEQSNN